MSWAQHITSDNGSLFIFALITCRCSVSHPPFNFQICSYHMKPCARESGPCSDLRSSSSPISTPASRSMATPSAYSSLRVGSRNLKGSLGYCLLTVWISVWKLRAHEGKLDGKREREREIWFQPTRRSNGWLLRSHKARKVALEKRNGGHKFCWSEDSYNLCAEEDQGQTLTP